MRTAIWVTWCLLLAGWFLLVAGWHLWLMTFWLTLTLGHAILLAIRVGADRYDAFLVSFVVSDSPKPLATEKPPEVERRPRPRMALSRSPGARRRRKAASQGQTRGTYAEPPKSAERRPPRPYDAG
jgi:hypothetical protein